MNGEPLVHEGWLLEPSLSDLKQRLRWVFEHQDEARAMGLKASRHAHECWSWKAAAKKVEIRLKHLAGQARREGLEKKQSIEPKKNRQVTSVSALVAAIEIYEHGENRGN